MKAAEYLALWRDEITETLAGGGSPIQVLDQGQRILAREVALLCEERDQLAEQLEAMRRVVVASEEHSRKLTELLEKLLASAGS